MKALLNIFTKKQDNKSKERNDILKLIAIISMAIDHIGHIFFPSYAVLRIIGRLALPIFAFGMVQGYKHTSSLPNYLSRILIVGLISQIPYAILFRTFELNILFLLFISLILLYVIDNRKYAGLIPIGVMMYLFPIDYGWYGLIMVALFFVFDNKRISLLIGQGVHISVFSLIKMSLYPFQILGVFLVLYFPKDLFKITLNRNIFYWFYPTHLIIILLIKIFIS